MEAQRYAVTYSLETVDTTQEVGSEKIILDQEGGWTELTGYLTEANFARYLGMLLYGNDFYEPLMNCGMAGVKLITAILAYPVSDVQFNIHTSYGELSSSQVTFPELKTLISFNASDSATVSFPINSIQSTTWLGNVYDLNHNKTTPPSLVAVGDNITLSKEVYGTLEMAYKTKRFEYVLTVEPRENTESYETKYDTYVYATYSGGVSWLKVSEPPNADDIGGGAPCGYTIDVNFGPNDDLPYADPEDQLIEYDYCLLEQIGDGEGEV